MAAEIRILVAAVHKGLVNLGSATPEERSALYRHRAYD
jgi:hypothetical protein